MLLNVDRMRVLACAVCLLGCGSAQRVGVSATTTASDASEWLRAVTPSQGNDAVMAIASGPNGAVVVGSRVMSERREGASISVLDAAGAVAWTQAVKSSHSVQLEALVMSRAGEVYAAGSFTREIRVGTTRVAGHERNDIFLAKFDAQGALLWLKSWGNEDGFESLHGMAMDGANNLVITGAFQDALEFGDVTLQNDGIYDVYVAKLNGDGTPLWAKQWHARGGTETRGNGVAIARDGSVYVTGLLEGRARVDALDVVANGGDAAFVAKLNAAGQAQWVKPLATVGDSLGRAIVVSGDGNVLVAGAFSGRMQGVSQRVQSVGNTDAFVASLESSSGAVRWVQAVGGPSFDKATALTVLSNGEVVLGGVLQGDALFASQHTSSAGALDGFVARFSTEGTPISLVAIGGVSDDAVTSLSESSDGMLLAGGFVQNDVRVHGETIHAAGGEDGFVLRARPSTLQSEPAVQASVPATVTIARVHRGAASSQIANADAMERAVRACADGDLATVRRLVPQQVGADAKQDSGWPLIMTAAYDGRAEVVAYLLEQNANPDAALDNSFTSLMQAARFGHMRVVQLLVEAGANVNAGDGMRNGTALHVALTDMGTHEDIARYLLAHGANVNARDSNGLTPLMAYLSEDHPDLELTRALLDAGASLVLARTDGYSPLMSAASHGLTDVVQLFLDRGARVDASDNRGMTAVYSAAHAGHADVLRMLLARGASPNASDSQTGETALMRAAQADHLEAVQVLVEAHAEVNAHSKQGDTALSMATRNRNSEVVRFLTAHGAR